jgi:hypothetical protein
MKRKLFNQAITILCGMIILQVLTTTSAQAATSSSTNKDAIREIHSLVPASIHRIDNALAVLDQGWEGMNTNQQEQFNRIFDPGDSGRIDDDYLETVRENYLKIRQKLDQHLTIEVVGDNDICTGQRLYYTDFLKIYACPYFQEELREERKVRTLIHETAHMALLVVDRPYYDPNSYSSRYHKLIPQGSWVTQIPLFGHLIREIVHNDTLYHPDTYAWFATEISQ